MSRAEKLTAIEKRAATPAVMTPFDLQQLKQQLPLVFPRDPDLPPSPKPHYRSDYRYLGFDDLEEEAVLESFSAFDIAVRLFDYTPLEPKERRIDYAMSNSFGFGGHNASIVVGALRNGQ